MKSSNTNLHVHYKSIAIPSVTVLIVDMVGWGNTVGWDDTVGWGDRSIDSSELIEGYTLFVHTSSVMII